MRDRDHPIEFDSPEEMPITPMSLGSTRVYRTGSWRYLEPYYQDLTPPCADRCLVGNDIGMIMRMLHARAWDEATRYLLRFNPMPSVLGRVCPHPCEQPCNRKALGGGIRIRAVERFLGDYALEHAILPDVPPATQPPVAVIGAGPAGLSAAYFLRLLGHPVTVYEKDDRPGGLLWKGIPEYRLPRDVLERELARFPQMGIRFEFARALGQDLTIASLRAQYPAVIIAVGFGRSRRLRIPGADHPGVIEGLRFLEQLHRGERVSVGPRVAVIGGGNTAMDCARCLIRLGCEVRVLYRRTRREMPAFKEEIEEAIEEGVQMEYLVIPVRVHTDGERLRGIECVRARLGEKDASGRPRPVPIEGSAFLVEVDTVVTALGETLDASVLDAQLHADGSIPVDDRFQTRLPGVYAIGDCTGMGGTVGAAVWMARAAAHAVHAELTGTEFRQPEPMRIRGVAPEIAKFKMFNRSYFTVAPPVPLAVRPPGERVRDFREYIGGLDAESAWSEAQRCFKCGTCTLCDNCRLFCPDAAIVKNPDGNGYTILYEYCKGCGVCVEECPRAAIHLRPVEIPFSLTAEAGS